MTYAKREPTKHETLQDQVVKLLAWTGWRHLHVRRTQGHGKRWTTSTNIKGWPDLAPIWSEKQPGRTIAIELKVPPDSLSAEQDEIRISLLAAGWEYYVVTPADLEDLPKILARRSTR